LAKQLEKLGVDIIEAGFPVSSPGDFEAVKRVAKEVRGPIICGLARAIPKDINASFLFPLAYSKSAFFQV